MRKLVMGTAAALLVSGFGAAEAADLGLRSREPVPPAPVQEAFSWSGFYFGASVGASRGKARWTDISGYNGIDETFTYRPGNVAGDLHAGYNLQSGMLVYGVEASVGHLNLKKDQQYPKFVGIRGPLDSVAATQGGFYAALTGKLGIAVDSLLIFGRGGLVTSDIRQKFTDLDPAGAVLTAGTATSQPRGGFTFGAGAALAMTQNLSLTATYDYFNFGHKSHTATDNWNNRYVFRHSLATSVFRIGLDYRFGGPDAPVAAKY